MPASLALAPAKRNALNSSIQHPVDAGGAPAADHRVDAAALQVALGLVQRKPRRDFECEAAQSGVIAALQHDAFEAVLGGEHRACIVCEFAVQSEHAFEIAGLLVDIGGGQNGVGQSAALDHAQPPFSALVSALLGSRGHCRQFSACPGKSMPPT